MPSDVKFRYKPLTEDKMKKLLSKAKQQKQNYAEKMQKQSPQVEQIAIPPAKNQAFLDGKHSPVILENGEVEEQLVKIKTEESKTSILYKEAILAAQNIKPEQISLITGRKPKRVANHIKRNKSLINYIKEKTIVENNQFKEEVKFDRIEEKQSISMQETIPSPDMEIPTTAETTTKPPETFKTIKGEGYALIDFNENKKVTYILTNANADFIENASKLLGISNSQIVNRAMILLRKELKM